MEWLYWLYKLYFLSPHPSPTLKPTPHTKLSSILDFILHNNTKTLSITMFVPQTKPHHTFWLTEVLSHIRLIILSHFSKPLFLKWDTRKFDKNIKYIVYTYKIILYFDGQTFHKHIRPKGSRTVLFKINLYSLISSLSKLYRCVPNGIYHPPKGTSEWKQSWRPYWRVVPNRSAQNWPLQRALRNEGFRRVQLMDTSGPHDPLRWFFPWWRRLRVGMT